MSTSLAGTSGAVLSERCPNTSSPQKSQTVVSTREETTEMFKHKTNDMKTTQEQTYISPSDNILSPTSKKLSEIKGKRFANVKSRSLFAKTVSKEGLKSQEKLNQFDKI